MSVLMLFLEDTTSAELRYAHLSTHGDHRALDHKHGEALRLSRSAFERIGLGARPAGGV